MLKLMVAAKRRNVMPTYELPLPGPECLILCVSHLDNGNLDSYSCGSSAPSHVATYHTYLGRPRPYTELRELT